METNQCSAKQIELHGELGRETAINLTEHLVSSEDVLWVVLEVKD